MKKASNRNPSGKVPKALIHTFLASPGIRTMRLSAGELNQGLRLHCDLGRLPLAFRDKRGRTAMVSSTSDLTKTLFFLPRERESFLKGWKIREIKSKTISD